METSASSRNSDEEVEIHGGPDPGDPGRGRDRAAGGEVCRKHGISTACYYQWKSKFAGMSVNELNRVKELETENAKLKRIYADLALENTAIKDALSRKL